MTDQDSSAVPDQGAAAAGTAAGADLGKPLADIAALVAELDREPDRSAKLAAEALRGLAEDSVRVAGEPGAGYGPALLGTASVRLMLLASYDRVRRCVMTLFDLANALAAPDTHPVAVSQLQTLATRLLPAMEAIRAGLHPVVALTAMRVEEQEGTLVLDPETGDEVRASLRLLDTVGQSAEAVAALELLARHLAERPGGTDAAERLTRILADAA
ncbi:hypothetical protein [Streptomyces sp. NPDC004658]|uniref:hypothetical protein n=1 Tax=Streptomyces sp. NPDC004658 TaxID=3154672 RepID=UPI0033AB45FE